MTDELFTVPESIDRLAAARRRYAAAVEAYDEAIQIDEDCDGFGIIPDEIKNEVAAARYELSQAEYERMKR